MLLLFALLLFANTKAAPASKLLEESENPTCNDIHNCRTLLGIIWSCLSTIFLCTWVAIHPNIPATEDTENMGFWERRKYSLYQAFTTKLPLFLCALFVPEYILAWAIRQRMVAGKIAKKMNLTTAHGFFITMGGFQSGHPALESDLDVVVRNIFGNGQNSRNDMPRRPFSTAEVIYLLDKKKIQVPTEAEIKDRSKSDWIAKLIVLLQTLWFVTQCIARHFQKLPTSELEIVTLAFTAINVGIYIAWWDKPQNVDCPILITKPYTLPTTPRSRHVARDIAKQPWWLPVLQTMKTGLEGTRTIIIEFFSLQLTAPATQIPLYLQPQHSNKEELNWWKIMPGMIVGTQDSKVNLRRCRAVPIFFAGNPTGEQVILANFITLGVGVGFGAIHCIAWSFGFRPSMERFIWRVSSAAMTGVPVFLILSFWVAYKIQKSAVFTLLIFLTVLSGLLYTAARITTLVLAFMQLASLPSGALQAVQWTLFIPHI